MRRCGGMLAEMRLDPAPAVALRSGRGDATRRKPTERSLTQPVLPRDRVLAEAPRGGQTSGPDIAAGQRRWVLGACIAASSMAFIDGTALTVALPALRSDLGADLATVQWVLNGYAVALAAFTLIGGALADAYGKARILTIGCLAFGAASAACALAPSPGWLIAARILQGFAAALVTSSSLALVGATYPPPDRNRAVGIWAGASALTTAGAPVLGGWLTETFGWEAVFWINPPLALATVAVLWRHAPPDRRAAAPLDLVGAALLAIGLAALAWLLSEIGSPASGQTEGRAGQLLAAAAVAMAGLFAYAFWERRTAHPMTPPRLLRNRPFTGLNIATFLIYSALAMTLLVLPFELIDRRGLGATEAGLLFLPFTLAVALLSQRFGALADRTGARVLLMIGPILAAAAYVWMALARDAGTVAGVIVPMLLLGVGFAVLVAPLTASVLSCLGDQDQGLASGVNNAVSRIAQLAGVALAAGLAAFTFGFEATLALAAATSIAAVAVISAFLPRTSKPT